MSLATRCIACGTVFRVVQDQLKISEGWVRCGRCNEVFNAIESLFDLEREAPPEWTPSPPSDEAIVTARLQTPSLPPADENEVLHLGDSDRIHLRFSLPEQELVVQDGLDSEAAIENPWTQPPSVETDSRNRKKPKEKKRDADNELPSPGFLQAARSKAHWESPRMRLALSALALLLACTLVAQAALHFRDYVAARWPGIRPLLVLTCAWRGCRVEYPRHIDDFSVESSSLSPANGGTAYKLSVVLRNRNPLLTLALPSIDLSLTDTNGQLVARRALSFADFRPGSRTLAPSAETTLQLLMSTGGRRISGYTVEIFYP